ncbi:hypothetical protein ACW5XF_02265 [Aeromonas lusitana]|uniref:Uncharacterized protein n=1 Tax=Aeromonas lusitana TaxID=931529 RepID=A0A2M8H8I3_9GAMM|nr:hypothetical protein [Aeromonas lusitana]PJC92868.1 hypothetical protein CUC44_12340 [Aeromonas lusitana]
MTELLDTPSSKVSLNFHAPVEYAAGGDVKIINELGGRLLTKRERKELHNLVLQLDREFGQKGWDTWTYLHEKIGVNEVGEMRLDHLKAAQALLQLMIEAKQAAFGTSLEEAWRQEYQSVCCDLLEQSEIEVNLRAELRHYQQAYSVLKCDHDRLQQVLAQHRVAAAQFEREKHSLGSGVTELQQRLSSEVQSHRHSEAELKRAANRAVGLEHQIDSLIAGRLVDSEALAQAQKKAEQAQRVVRRLRGSLICGGVLAVLATGAAVYKPLFQAELRAEQSKAVMLKRKDICLFDGEPFSWGTRINTPTGIQKCVKSRTGQYLWQFGK